MTNIYTIIIAAGKGTRMNSDHSKLIQKINDVEMIKRVALTAKEYGSSKIIAVVGHKKEEIKDVLKGMNIEYVEQKELLGTGHATMMAVPKIDDDNSKVVILYGDIPIIKASTISKLVEKNIRSKESATILTAIYNNPFGYGRIIRDEGGSVLDIREEKDASDEERKIKEINAGIYCFDAKVLKESLLKLKPDNIQREYYLTDVIKIINSMGKKTGAYTVIDNTEILGVNDRIQLELITRVLRERINRMHMQNGVTIIDSNSTYIYDNVEIGKDTIIYPGVIIQNGAKIGKECTIGAYSIISSNAEIEDNAIIEPFSKI